MADGQDPAYAIARELVGVLPFGARDDTVAGCARLTERVGAERVVAAVVEAIESVTAPVHLPGHHGEPMAPGLVRRMLHVLLATRDLGWPGLDAPLTVRRVAAADLFFDATQTVLGDDDWKGPNGVEFALLQVLAGRLCRLAPLPSPDGEGTADQLSPERLGQLHRMQRPRGL
jgi:hypothetical protein